MSFQERFGAFSSRLRTIGKNEPLTKFSFFLIILLDIFIFSMILEGISENTQTLSRPEEYAGYECTSLIRDMTQDERRVRLRDTIGSYYRDSYYSYSYSSPYGNAPGCKALEDDVSRARQNTELSTIIQNIRDTEEKIRGIKTEMNNISSQYDTMLLEKIADQKPENAITPTTAEEAKGKLNFLEENLKNLNTELTNLHSNFDNHQSVKKITDDITTLAPVIQKTYDKLVFWYPVKRFGVEILFILPLLIFTIWWSNRSIRRENGLQTLIASHLLGIIAIFILLKAIEFIYDIIPHRLLEQIYDILMSWNIIGILYYLFIFLGVLATMGVIYIIQKKLFSPDKLQARRADREQCYICGEKLQEGNNHCIRCGVSQQKECSSCGKMTNVTSKYCGNCGEKI